MKLTTAIARMIPCATLLVCLLMPVLASADERKENMLIEYVRLDEDATSSFYYFFYSPLHGDYIEKVRILWNGGASSRPFITDYIFESGKIRVVEMQANQADLGQLTQGLDGQFEMLGETVFASISEAWYVSMDVSNPNAYTAGVLFRNLLSALLLQRAPVKATDAHAVPKSR